ncbi:TraR/DksA C4-type zinc finger protein [Jiangella sp. DSM 45060]|uniref:TraR/DksA family transcriptional regulator n=1 Tax=Jiangella sp. DSM 45060 TaxID=1798224 RepID=UPI00087B2E2E|nr:TraR/DksA C4-type zinc finger protein [Jiangella sp. DSM 45060]SDT70899.1 dksA/traR C4-type zinc finger [Jiangella sp. DSM 45060]
MNTHEPQTIPADVRQGIDTVLKDAETSRQRQFDDLPPPCDGDPTPASAHRQTVARILAEIRAARQRLADGTFGLCERCRKRIPAERLELRPWTSVCVRCAGV